MTDSETVFSTVDAVTGIDIDNERLDNADDLAEYSERHRQAVLDAPVMLRVRELDKSFEGLHAVNKVSFDLHQGEVISIIGPNGSGKSTTINLISGFLQPDSGLIDLADEPVAGLSPADMSERGLLRTFQIAHEFGTLSVRENLMMVPPEQPGEGLWDAWFRPGRVRAREAEVRARADEVIDFLEIPHVADEFAGNLSGGQKKLLELGRTMMVDAKIVFLDEVGAGVNRTLLNTIGDAILRLNRERGYTFCMIEHDMDFIGRLCDPVIVMAEGRVLAEGTAAEVKSNEAVIEAYLGRGLKNKVRS